MTATARPRPVLTCSLLLGGAALTGFVGSYAYGYLVPAATMLAAAALLWSGKLTRLVRWTTLLNLVAGTLLVLVLAFGDFLGAHKLDVSGVSLLANLLAGGPLMSLLALPVLRATAKNA